MRLETADRSRGAELTLSITPTGAFHGIFANNHHVRLDIPRTGRPAAGGVEEERREKSRGELEFISWRQLASRA